MNLTRRASRLAAVVAALACAAPTAYADEPPTPTDGEDVDPGATAMEMETRAHHRRGLELYDDGDLRLALIEFERAFALSQSYKVLFNVGQVHYELKAYARARLAFEQYLALGGERIGPARRADVERDLTTLRARTATLTVRANVPDVEITVGERPLGRAPVEDAIVDAGIARIKATKRGYDALTRELTLAGGDVQTVSLELVATKRDVVVTHTTTGLPATAVAGWIVTGVLAAGATGAAIAANAANADYERRREAPISGSTAAAKDDLERQRDLVTGLALTTDVLALTALVAGGLSLYFTLREPRQDKPYVSAALGGARLVVGF